MVDESQEPAAEAALPRLDSARRTRIWLDAVILGSVFLGYAIPFLGIVLSVVAPTVVLSARREVWDVGLRRAALLAVFVWIGLWLPAILSFFTDWVWLLTESDHSTTWLLLPLAGPENLVVGTLVPAAAAVVVFAVGLRVSVVLRRPWLVVVGAWLTPWAHALAFALVVTEMVA